MCESKIKAYKLDEGKLPKDPSKIEDPNGDVQKLAEKEEAKKTQKKEEKEADVAINPDIETANAGKTEEPELTGLQKEAAKETPVDKLTQNKEGEDPLKGEPKVKEEKKIEPEITGVAKESKLPDDPSQVKDPVGDVQKLAEEKVLTTVSDEGEAKQIASKFPGARVEQHKTKEGKNVFAVWVAESKEKVIATVLDEKVAKDISLKYPGSRIVNDKTPDGKNQFIVMVKEQKVNEISSFKEVIDSTISKLTAERIGQLAGVKLELSNPIESDVSWVWKINTPEYDEVRLFKKDGVIFLSKGDKTQKQISANESKEKVIATVLDEKVAKDISQKYPGSRIVSDKTPDGKNQFIVMVKESLTPPLTVASNITKSEDGKFIVGWVGKNEKGIPQTYIKSFVSETEAQQFQDQMNKRVVKEDIDVTVKADGEEINVTSTPDGIQATKVNPEVQPIDRVETGVEVVEEPAEVVEEEPDFYEGEEEWSEEETGEMEEKIALSAHLGTLEKLTEKQKKFKDEVDGKKIGKKNKAKLKKK